MKFFDTVRLFYFYVRPFRKQFAMGLLALLGVDLLNAFPPLILKGFIDQVSATLEGDHGYSPYLWLGLAYAAIALGQGVCRYLWRVWLIKASFRAAEQVRQDYFAKLQRLPPSFFHENSIGDLMAMATNDVEAVRFALGPGLLVFADATFLFISLPPAMLWLSPKFTFLALAPMILLPFVMMRAERLVHDRFEAVQAQFSKLSGFAQENVEGIRIVKAFAREFTQLRRFSDLGREFISLNLNLAKAQSVFEPLFLLTVSLGLASLLIFGGKDVITGAVGLGTFVAFTRYLDNLAWPMMAYGMSVTLYQRGKTSLERIQEILKVPESRLLKPADTAPVAPAFVPSAPLLEARNLTFCYPGKKEPALKNINFRIEAGTRTGLVGPIGSGKSTLVQLLSGLQEVDPGMLFWRGVDVTTIPIATRRDALAVVPQDVLLFSESLGWNVAMGINSDFVGTTESLVETSLNDAGLGSETKVWGLDASIGEKGLSLSGGQKARVALARALCRHSQLLVLDDALSSVDAETESRILDQLAQNKHLAEDGALLMVTHRFAGLWKFDQVLVFRHGELIQSGASGALARAPGLYGQLLELQRMEDALA